MRRTTVVETEPPPTLRSRLRELYFGDSCASRRFRYGLIAFDLLVVLFFVISASLSHPAWIGPVDVTLGVLLTIELVAHVYATANRRAQIFSLATLADVAVIISMLLPAFVPNLGFLRILRAVRLIRSYRMLSDLRQSSQWFRLHEDVIKHSLNLVVFIFIITSIVHVTQYRINPELPTYIDALYFTITTLTTTGFGDITLVGTGGRLLAVIIMVVGVTLFLRLLKALFRPNKVRFECSDCGLLIHDADAVHCKHCGRVLHIHTEGAV
ncbi:potassium channel family protein [Rhodoligotrophos ferricapiens]|uniref:potassium channel family protein n=1 Tax=Rhodoligotrophos ferricapiens TaxID=3069264 RepID=UPI00315C9A9D